MRQQDDVSPGTLAIESHGLLYGVGAAGAVLVAAQNQKRGVCQRLINDQRSG